MLRVYLDSSALVKRYISEPGSSIVDLVFDKSLTGELTAATSIWNIGEVLGVLDLRRKRRWLSEDEFKEALENFAGEIVKMLRLKVLEIFPALTKLIADSWPLILSEHVYEADALQVQTCIYSGSSILLSADKKLVTKAIRMGIRAVDTADESKIKELLEK